MKATTLALFEQDEVEYYQFLLTFQKIIIYK